MSTDDLDPVSILIFVIYDNLLFSFKIKLIFSFYKDYDELLNLRNELLNGLKVKLENKNNILFDKNILNLIDFIFYKRKNLA